MQFAMDQVIKGATAIVRRQIVVGGDRCLDPHEEPFQFNKDILQVKAWSDPDRCITWGILDSVINGLRQCGYDQGKYNAMRCIIVHVRQGEIGFVSLGKMY